LSHLPLLSGSGLETKASVELRVVLPQDMSHLPERSETTLGCTAADRAAVESPEFELPMLRQSLDFDAVKAGDAVRFGPQRDFAGVAESAVGGCEHLFAVERDGEAFALGL